MKKEKRARPSTSSQAAAGRAAKAPRVSAARRNGRAAKDASDDEDDGVPDFNKSHVGSSDKYQDVKDWEEIVQSIDTIEKGSDSKLMVYLTMYVALHAVPTALIVCRVGGEKVAQTTEVVYRRCPMKVSYDCLTARRLS